MDFRRLFDDTLSDRPRSHCTSYYCTTCGGQFNRVRKQVANLPRQCVSDFLRSLRFEDFVSYGVDDNWRLYIRYLLLGADVVPSGEAGEIIDKWYREVPEVTKADFVDFIIFYFLRDLPSEDPLKQYWISEGLRRLDGGRNLSLVETLVLVMKNDCPREVLDIAISSAEHDEQMERVLINACGHGFLRGGRNPA